MKQLTVKGRSVEFLTILVAVKRFVDPWPGQLTCAQGRYSEGKETTERPTGGEAGLLSGFRPYLPRWGGWSGGSARGALVVPDGHDADPQSTAKCAAASAAGVRRCPR